MNHIFELVDSTDEETYHSLGLFLTLQDAIAAVESAESPSHLGPTMECHDEYMQVEVRQRPISLNETYETVWKCAFKHIYDESDDGYEWKRTITETP